MPKRTDIKTILIIGAGPIVIGQACEFDYSGAQACKALRDEGYRVILVNSNPATIMTDPELADATYIEPITPEMVAQDHREGAAGRAAADDGRPDRAQHRDGAGARRARWRSYGVELIGANARGDRQGRGPPAVPRGDGQDRPRIARRAGSCTSLEEAREALEPSRPAGDHPAVLHAGRHRRRHRLQPRGVRARSCAAASTPRRSHEVLIEESVLGWKEYEMEVVRDRARQLHHRLLDRERRPDGRPHRRLRSPSRRR